MFQARAMDIGWRIDYFCISKVLKENLKDSYILKDVLGSDDVPIVMEFKMIGLNTIKFINSLKIKKNRELNQKAFLLKVIV